MNIRVRKPPTHAFVEETFFDFLQKIEEEVPQDDSAAFEEKLILYSLIRSLNPNVVVETGTHKGKTTLYMANALYDNGKGIIYTCDPFDYGQRGNFNKFPEFENIIHFHPVRGVDLEIEGSIDLLFLDGFHQKENPLGEFKHFEKRLSKNALVIFHDCWEMPEDKKQFADVDGAVKELGLKTAMIPTMNCLRIYSYGDWHG